MPGRGFVDTNVLVYAVDDADPLKRDVARGVLEHPTADLVLSAQVLSEFYVVVTRRLATPMSEGDAAAAVDELARLPTVATDTELVRDGIALARDARISFWDALDRRSSACVWLREAADRGPWLPEPRSVASASRTRSPDVEDLDRAAGRRRERVRETRASGRGSSPACATRSRRAGRP